MKEIKRILEEVEKRIDDTGDRPVVSFGSWQVGYQEAIYRIRRQLSTMESRK